MGRWKHEIQIAILRRRGAMARAVLPRTTAHEDWMLSGRAGKDEELPASAAILEEEDAESYCSVDDEDLMQEDAELDTDEQEAGEGP